MIAIISNQFLDGLGRIGVNGMARFVCADMCFEIPSDEPHVSDEVQHLVPAAFVREIQHQIAEISLGSNFDIGLVEKNRHLLEDIIRNRMLHNHDGVVHISALHEALACQVLNLVEEAESAAYGYLGSVVHRLVPMCGLHSEHAGIEIHGDIVGYKMLDIQ